MKKLFTLVTFALMAVLGANAQTWKQADTTAPEAGAKLIDNDLVTVSTVSATTAKQMQDEDSNPLPVTIGDYTFTHYIQVRTDSPDPNADNPTGGVMDGSTALVVTAKKDADVTFYFRRQKGGAGFDKDDGKDLLCWAQNGAKLQSEEKITEIPGNENYAYAAKTYKFVEGGIYTIYRRGSTVSMYGIDVVAGTAEGGNEGSSINGTVILSWNEVPTLSTLTTEDMANVGSSNNVATWENGISIMIMRSDKAMSSGENLTIDDKSYKTIKVSNGAQNKLILPEGKVTKKLILYSYVNAASEPANCYWKEVAGTTYSAEEATLFTAYIVDKKHVGIDKCEYTFDATNEVTFTNTGTQCCYVAVVEVEDASAEAQGDRRWDFTNWSEATINNLKADAAASTDSGWSDDEKNDGSNMDLTADNCFWAAADMTPNADGELSANGVVIEELKGLKFTGDLTSRNLAIAVNYSSTSLGTYHGGAYLWLGGKNKKFFTIPAVAGGSTIKMGVESHKPTEGRGVELYIGGTKMDGPAVPGAYEEQTWTVPEGETVDVVVDNTNGCHVYFIEVTSDGANSIKEVVKVINNGAVYNLAGQKVDENYKGVVIKNGKKMLQK